MKTPGHKEWDGGYGCPDGGSDFRNFNGVSHERAVEMFQENSYVFHEDIQYMPVKVSEFYLKAYAEYIISEDARGDYEGAIFFIYTVTSLEKELFDFSAEMKEYTVFAVKHIIENEEKFDENVIIDEGMRKRLDKLEALPALCGIL